MSCGKFQPVRVPPKRRVFEHYIAPSPLNIDWERLDEMLYDPSLAETCVTRYPAVYCGCDEAKYLLWNVKGVLDLPT